MTRLASADGLAAGSDYVYLGVFAENPVRSRSTSDPGSSGSAAACPGPGPLLMAGAAGEALRATLAALAADAPPAPAARLHALGWATVELDRAERELSAASGLPAAPSCEAPDSGVLGARCRVALDDVPRRRRAGDPRTGDGGPAQRRPGPPWRRRRSPPGSRWMPRTRQRRRRPATGRPEPVRTRSGSPRTARSAGLRRLLVGDGPGTIRA